MRRLRKTLSKARYTLKDVFYNYKIIGDGVILKDVHIKTLEMV